jgi:hypothetical protein
MRKRLLWIGIAGVILVPSASCASAVVPRAPYIRHLQVDSAMVDFLTEIRDQQTAERVLCLYGAIRNDTAWINFIKPARMRSRSETRAAYDSCPAAVSATATYLGVWHGHNVPAVTWDDLCKFSETDNNSFKEDKDSYVELLSCRGKLMARSKFK